MVERVQWLAARWESRNSRDPLYSASFHRSVLAVGVPVAWADRNDQTPAHGWGNLNAKEQLRTNNDITGAIASPKFLVNLSIIPLLEVPSTPALL